MAARRRAILDLIVQTADAPGTLELRKLGKTFKRDKSTISRDVKAIRKEMRNRLRDRDIYDWFLIAQAAFEADVRHYDALMGDAGLLAEIAFEDGGGLQASLRTKLRILRDRRDTIKQHVALGQMIGVIPKPAERIEIYEQRLVAVIVGAVSEVDPDGKMGLLEAVEKRALKAVS